MRVFLSPTGVLLLGALVHDYVYEFGSVPKVGNDEKRSLENLSRKEGDNLFLRICMVVNGLGFVNYISYFLVRVLGWPAWYRYKKTRGY